MISNYFAIFQHSFNTLWWFHLFIILLFIIATIALIFMTILCVLDIFYRPNIPQYPYNLFFDRMCPIIFIMSPAIIIYTLNPGFLSFIQKFLCIILIHTFVLIPVLYLWSKHRNWHSSKYYGIFFLDNPFIFLHIAIGMIYPAFWGLLLSLNRYLNVNLSLNIVEYLTLCLNIFNDFIFIFVILVFYIRWYKNFIKIILMLRALLWQGFSNMCYTLYCFLLQYKIFFLLFKLLHKISFIVGNFIIISQDIYPNKLLYPKYRYIIKYIYFKPKIILLFLVSFFICELILFNGIIHYTLILIFIYTLCHLFMHFLLLMYRRDFIEDVCVVDYLLKNWDNLRYPSYFLLNFEPSELKFYWSYTEEELKKIDSLKKKAKCYKYKPMLITRVQGLGYCYRIKATYRTLYSVRWMWAPKRIHNLTPLYLQNFIERAYLLSLPEGWRTYYPIIQMLEKKGYKTLQVPTDFYKNHEPPNKQTFATLMEHNVITNFTILSKNKIIVENFKNQRLDTQRQPNPDVVIQMNNQYGDNRTYGLDQKSDPSSKNVHGYILSNISDASYSKALRRFQSDLMYNCSKNNIILNFGEITKGLELLLKTMNNLDEHYLAWAQIAQHFPKEFIPPIRVKSNFCTADLADKYKYLWEKVPKKVELVSDYLIKKKIPEIGPVTERPSLPPESLELFADSALQALLSQG